MICDKIKSTYYEHKGRLNHGKRKSTRKKE